jgi:hypothetical protein
VDRRFSESEIRITLAIAKGGNARHIQMDESER